MAKYSAVKLSGFESEEDFHYVLKLMESTGWIFLVPLGNIMEEINWENAKIFSSRTDPRRLYVTDEDSPIWEWDNEININEMDKKTIK